MGEVLFEAGKAVAAKCRQLGLAVEAGEALAIASAALALPVATKDCTFCWGLGTIRRDDGGLDRCRVCNPPSLPNQPSADTTTLERLVVGAEIAWFRDEHVERAKQLLKDAGAIARGRLSATPEES